MPRPVFSLLRPGRWALLLGLGGCVEQYMPDVVEAPNSYLVVDGFINGAGRTRIKLSRTTNIAANGEVPVVRGATMYIVDNANQRYQVRESTVAGSYISDSLLLNTGRQYRLRITIGNTGTAPVYESALVPMKVTPAFDQLELTRQNGQVQVRASAHDATGQTRFYRWRTYETWEFNSAYKSELEVKNNKVGPRTTPIYTCYRSEQPSTIRHTSTASLSQDAVSSQLVLPNSDRDERFKIRYSVLVVQAAETAEEFAYNEILRKNTEAVGTVNDPLPAQLTGNVRRVGNESEPVLGFVSAHTQVQRRLFATPTSLGLPPNWVFTDPYADCTLGYERVPNPDEKLSQQVHLPYTKLFNSGDNVPTTYYMDGSDTLGYYGARRSCVDCRVRGTTTKPSFW